MKNLTQEWLKAANDDLLTIQHIIDVEHLTNIVAFHSEQAVEKCFKALLEEKSIDFPKTHDLSKLHRLLPLYDALEIDEETLLKINELYIDSRYPGELGLLPNGKPTLEDANEFYQFARNTYEKIREVVEHKDESDQPTSMSDAV